MAGPGKPVIIFQGSNELEAQIARDVLLSATIPVLHLPSLSTGIFGVPQTTRVAVPEQFVEPALAALREAGLTGEAHPVPTGLAEFRDTVKDRFRPASPLPRDSRMGRGPGIPDPGHGDPGGGHAHLRPGLPLTPDPREKRLEYSFYRCSRMSVLPPRSPEQATNQEEMMRPSSGKLIGIISVTAVTLLALGLGGVFTSTAQANGEGWLGVSLQDLNSRLREAMGLDSDVRAPWSTPWWRTAPRTRPGSGRAT